MNALSKFSALRNVFLGPVCPYGHDHGGGSYRHRNNWTCAECQRERILRWHRSEAGKIARKKTKTKNKQRIIAAAKSYRKSIHERAMAYQREYIAKNKEWHTAYYRAYNPLRRARKLMATPKWADLDAIRSIYEEAELRSKENGVKYHVDHIVPLISDEVCGLHVPENLRIMVGVENIRKGNRRVPEWDIA